MMESRGEPVFMFEVDKNRVEEEQHELRIFFEHYLPKNFKPRSVMDFACGIANEEPLLRDLYGDDIEIVSFDRDQSMVQTAQSLGRKSVIQASTSEIPRIIQDKKFDLILGRNIPINPNFNHVPMDDYPDPWPEFLGYIKKRMLSESYLLTTFAREDEYMRALALLDENNFDIILHEKSVVVVPSDRIGIAGADTKDDYIVISRRGSNEQMELPL